MKPYEIHDGATSDLEAALAYYDRASAGTGRRFLLAVDESIQKLLFDPSARPVIAGEVRRQPVDGFPHQILYIDEPHRVWIVAVAHYKRRSTYWLNRL